MDARAVRMVADQIEARGVRDPAVLRAMRVVPRDLFVPPGREAEAWDDNPLPIGLGQTVSQPYVVAAMTEALRVFPGMRVLEVGTGSGYQAAVLAEAGAVVHSIERHGDLAREAAGRLARLGYRDVTVHVGDGYDGLPGLAPFDGVMVTAAPPFLPGALVEQLRPGGRMVIPIGEEDQELFVIERSDHGLIRTPLFAVRFVAMVRSGPPDGGPGCRGGTA